MSGRAVTRRNNLIVVVVAALTIVGVGAIAGYGVDSTRTTALSTYRAGPNFEGISFTYPASWRPAAYTENSSFSSIIVYLSNQAMYPPCQDGTCGLPLARLDLGGILAFWSANGFPAWSFDAAPGELTSVAGRRAKLSTRLSWCRAIGGDVQFTVLVERPEAAHNWYQFDACIRGPGEQTIESQVQALLASTKLP